VTADEFFALSTEEAAALPAEAFADMEYEDLIIVMYELKARMRDTAKRAITRRAAARGEVRQLEELWEQEQ
jgi:hypothetical protein